MSTMYKYTRQEAAEQLWISTRSVDRYIKAWKLRSKKEWKIVYVNEQDIINLWWDTEEKQEIIVENNDKKEEVKKEEAEKNNNENIEGKKEDEEEKNEEKYQVVDSFEEKKEKEEEKKSVELKSNFKAVSLEKIYDDLREEIKEKDETIQDLSIRLWRAEEIVKNSVSIIDFKRSQMLLEDSKTHLWTAISDLKTKNEDLTKKVKNDKTMIFVLFISVVVLLILSSWIWIYSIWK